MLVLYMVFVAHLPHHGVPQDAIFSISALALEKEPVSPDIACSFKCFAVWVTLLVFHNSTRIIAVAETVHGVHVRIYFFCKCGAL